MQHELGTRCRIVAAARHLFATQGFHQTPMSELATAAGVSVGQIYRHFAGKADVILAIVQGDADERYDEMLAIPADVRAGTIDIESGFARLATLAMSKGDEALSFDILAEAHRNPRVAETIAGLCGGYRHIIRELACLANPALSDAALDSTEELLLALMFGLSHRGLSRPCMPVADTARSTARMIMAALAPR